METIGDEMGFKNKFGMTTAEFRHDYFNEMSYGWNGRGWPFKTQWCTSHLQLFNKL